MIGSDGLDTRQSPEKTTAASLVSRQCHLTRVISPDLTQLFFSSYPDARSGSDLPSQLRSLYQGIFACLDAEGAVPEQVVAEKVFFRDVMAGHKALSELRAREFGEPRWSRYSPASLLLEEPPSRIGQQCSAQLHVVIPAPDRPHRWWNFGPSEASRNGGQPPSPPVGKALAIDGKQHFWLGNVLGRSGGGFYPEALSMFEAARDILATQGVKFTSVVRTWIYLREMERDYGELNRARRDFFRSIDIRRRPASTGIGGFPPAAGSETVLGLYAVAGVPPSAIRTMHTPTLNEAHEYGSDFSRGMSVEEGGRRTLFISGTASVDEQGRTVALYDFEAQVERMLLNVEMLLENDGASFEDVACAITYLKDIRDADRYHACLLRRGIPDFPHNVVKAEVCRPELLCETEMIAVIPARG